MSAIVVVRQIHKVNVLIRRPPAAETLGRAAVICTNKTGTLTEEDLCNNTRDKGGEFLGNPAEVALARAAKKVGLDSGRKMAITTAIFFELFFFASLRKKYYWSFE